MRSFLAHVLTLAAIVAIAPAIAAQQPPAPPPPAIKVGQTAPDFTLKYLASVAGGKFEEKSVSLSDFKGKKSVILAFFPAAFSPG